MSTNEAMASRITDARDDPTREYPSHTVEETEEETAAEEVIEDESDSIMERIVEDVLGEPDGEVVEAMREAEQPQPVPVYPEGTTVQGLRNAVAEATESWDSEPTGTSITVTTNSSTGTQYVNIDGQTIVVGTTPHPPSTDATKPDNPDMDSLFRAPDKEKVKYERVERTPEQVAQVRANRKEYHKTALKIKRRTKLSDMQIGMNDLIITMDTSHVNFYHSDTKGIQSIEGVTPRLLRRKSSIIAGRLLRSYFTFDKNLRRVILNSGRMSNRGVPRVDSSQIPKSSGGIDGDTRNFVIVDKDAFLESNGRVWKIRYKQEVSYARIKIKRKAIIQRFSEMERAVSWLKFNLEMSLNPDDFEILYNIEGNSSGYATFIIFFRYHDVTIRNSFDLQRPLGEMILSSECHHYYNLTGRRSDEKPFIIIRSGVCGTRMTFTPTDAAKSYQHSHLTSAMTPFRGFCTGEHSYSSSSEGITDIDLEQHVLRLEQFVSWESLEGGPHNRMEDIHLHGKPMQLNNGMAGANRTVDSSYMSRMIYEINQTEKKFDAFADAFKLMNKNGRIKFIVDYNMFYQIFMNIISSEKIKSIYAELGERPYMYKSTSQEFYKIDDTNTLDASKIIAKAYENMRKLKPIYMNGKYIRPRLITHSTENIMEGIIFCPEPNFMKELAQVILHNLTIKLEEYGEPNNDESPEAG